MNFVAFCGGMSLNLYKKRSWGLILRHCQHSKMSHPNWHPLGGHQKCSSVVELSSQGSKNYFSSLATEVWAGLSRNLQLLKKWIFGLFGCLYIMKTMGLKSGIIFSKKIEICIGDYQKFQKDQLRVIRVHAKKTTVPNICVVRSIPINGLSSMKPLW